MDMDMNQVKGWLDDATNEAKDVINNPSKVDDLLKQAEDKLRDVPAIGDKLADVPLMIAMVKSWITKEYTEVSPKVIACLVGSVIYLLKKKDLISDSIPVLGMVDDLGVLALALQLCKPELDAFSAWRDGKKGEIIVEAADNAEESKA